MKRTSIIAALVLSAVSSTIAQQQSARTRDAASTEQAVQKQDQERIRAQIAADTIALRRIYADDFLGIGPTGLSPAGHKPARESPGIEPGRTGRRAQAQSPGAERE